MKEGFLEPEEAKIINVSDSCEQLLDILQSKLQPPELTTIPGKHVIWQLNWINTVSIKLIWNITEWLIMQLQYRSINCNLYQSITACISQALCVSANILV